MTDYLSGLFSEPRPFDVIPTQNWSEVAVREQYEMHFGTPVGKYGYIFQASQYPQIEAINRIGSAVAVEMNEEFSKDGGGFQSICRRVFGNPNGTFSQGVILLGAVSRDIAEKYQRDFGFRINSTLEALNANVRLGDHSI